MPPSGSICRAQHAGPPAFSAWPQASKPLNKLTRCRYYNKGFMALLRQTTEDRKGRAPGSEAVAA